MVMRALGHANDTVTAGSKVNELKAPRATRFIFILSFTSKVNFTLSAGFHKNSASTLKSAVVRHPSLSSVGIKISTTLRFRPGAIHTKYDK